jgi:hypothetical protein
MGNNDQSAGQQAGRDEPLLAIIEAFIRECNARTGKDRFSILKIQAVFGEVALVLCLVPFVSRPQMYLFL